ncbi:hypothetical protein HK101_009713 [Irineochytrium annulatum]|nr:hypothetical protein HK101_009713 [Irineochytrium annulatum]
MSPVATVQGCGDTSSDSYASLIKRKQQQHNSTTAPRSTHGVVAGNGNNAGMARLMFSTGNIAPSSVHHLTREHQMRNAKTAAPTTASFTNEVDAGSRRYRTLTSCPHISIAGLTPTLHTQILSSIESHLKQSGNGSIAKVNGRRSPAPHAPQTVCSVTANVTSNGRHSAPEDDTIIHVGSAANVTAEVLEDRASLDISATLFFTLHSNPDHVQRAIDQVKAHLHVSRLDSIIAHWTPSTTLVPSTTTHSDDECYPSGADVAGDFLSGILPYWQAVDAARIAEEKTCMEVVREGGVVGDEGAPARVPVGVSGFSQSGLEFFLPSARVKPDHVLIPAHETVSPAIERLAKSVGFEIRVQADSAETLPDGPLGELISKLNDDPAVSVVTPEWIVKYTVFAKTRGVLLAKGYIVMATSQS